MKDYSSYGRNKHSVTNGLSQGTGPGRMKRLNARLHDDPEFAAQHAMERMKAINAKSTRRTKARHRNAVALDYLFALTDFTENEDCSPVEAVPHNPRCMEIARRFNKTADEVARDINRVYLDTYNP